MTLIADLYELTMLQAYFEEEMVEPAVFSLFVRKLPAQRRFVLAAGIEPAIDEALRLHFDASELAAIESIGLFSRRFLRWLGELRFTGTIRAVPEGTPLFGDEPLLEVTAPLPEAQILESVLLQRVHYSSVVASKVARVVGAAAGRRVIDFGLRRAPGTDASLELVRAGVIAGLDGTSSVLAGHRYGVPIVGTMAHSYIQAHDSELEAFGAFASLYPETVLLVDTYDTLEGVRRVIDLARRVGDDFRVRGVRLDSGDLDALSRSTRRLLDDAGLGRVQIIASGGLDEYRIETLLRAGAPIDAFGVGTRMAVSEDAPSLDLVYKLVSYGGIDRTKRSPGKHHMPGPKQVWREAHRDLVARLGEPGSGRPLLHEVVRDGQRIGRAPSLMESRAYARNELAGLHDGHVDCSPSLDAWR